MPLPASDVPPAPAENEQAAPKHESAETLALMAQRRSCKVAWLAEPCPDDAQLEALIRLAARVPDHGKLGPWRFVIIAGEARARAGDALANVIRSDAGVDQTRLDFARGTFSRAPVCVMVVSAAQPHPKIPEWEQQLSAGMAAFALMIAAHAMGFAGCILTEWPAYDQRARAALGLAEHERVAAFVYLGTASQPLTERVRVDAASRTSRF